MKRTYSDDFEQAWANRCQRPNESKVDGYRAWEACRKCGDMPALVDMLIAQDFYKEYVDRTKTAAQFVQHFATFINKRTFVYWIEQARKVPVQKQSKNDGPLEIPAIMSRVFEALGPERYQARFSGCDFEERGEVIVIRTKHRYWVERLEAGPADLIERITKRRVRVEMAA